MSHRRVSCYFFGDERVRCRHFGASTTLQIRNEAVAISRAGQGAEAWYRTCCYWFCGANGAGGGGRDSIGESGFWAIIEQQKIAAFGSSYILNAVTCRSSRRLRSFDSQATKSPPIGGLPVFT
jgi:hypothetical protein